VIGRKTPLGFHSKITVRNLPAVVRPKAASNHIISCIIGNGSPFYIHYFSLFIIEMELSNIFSPSIRKFLKVHTFEVGVFDSLDIQFTRTLELYLYIDMFEAIRNLAALRWLKVKPSPDLPIVDESLPRWCIKFGAWIYPVRTIAPMLCNGVRF